LYANHEDSKTTINGQVFDQKFLSTGEVKPEKINSIEVGYLFSNPGSGLNLDTRVFHNKIYDVLDRVNFPYPDVRDGRAKTLVNLTEIAQLGLEYQLRWRPSHQGWLVLSQSWVDTDSDQDVNYPPSVPRSTLSLLAAYQIAGIDVSLGYYRTSKMRWLGSDQENPESKYNRLDLRLAKNWKTSEGRIETALVLQSLLGEERESFQNYVGQLFARRGYLSLKYEFR
jgi:outer membrane receptor protein involved in Fe transport